MSGLHPRPAVLWVLSNEDRVKASAGSQSSRGTETLFRWVFTPIKRIVMFVEFLDDYF